MDEKEFYQELGAKIRFHRKRMGWTQGELGQRLGLSSVSIISQYETGRSMIGVYQLVHFAQLVGMPLSEFVGDTAPVAPLSPAGME